MSTTINELHPWETESSGGPRRHAEDARTPLAPARAGDARGVEIPVTIHASRYVSAPRGAAKNLPPVHEETRTVVVFPNGGVVRTFASFTAGELVVLTNKQTGADVICRVTNVKAQLGTQNYVNLEFTQQAPGFGGAESYTGDHAEVVCVSEDPSNGAMGAAAMGAMALGIQNIAEAVPFSMSGTAIAPIAELADERIPEFTFMHSNPRLGLMDSLAVKHPFDFRELASKFRSKRVLWVATAAVLFLCMMSAGAVMMIHRHRFAVPGSRPAGNVPEQTAPLPHETVNELQETAPAAQMLLPPPVKSVKVSEQASKTRVGAIDSASGLQREDAISAVPSAASPQAVQTEKAPSVPHEKTEAIAYVESNSADTAAHHGSVAEQFVAGKIQPPQPRSGPAPVYPDDARGQRIQGKVVVDALVDNSGDVTLMEVLSGPPLLRTAALDALRIWKFDPAKLDGRPVAAHTKIGIVFRVR